MSGSDVQVQVDGNSPESEKTPKPRFSLPKLPVNKTGWGPIGIPEQFKYLSFEPFNKAEKIGKIADWTQPEGGGWQDRRRFQQQQQSFAPDENSFHLVDTSKPMRSLLNRGNKIRNQQVMKRQVQKERERRQQAGYTQSRYRDQRQWQQSRGRGRGGYTGRGWVPRQPQKVRQPSVLIDAAWNVFEEMEFARLNKLRLPESQIEGPIDIGDHSYGALYYYDKTFDKTSVKMPRNLERHGGKLIPYSTVDDEVIQQLAMKNEGNVFADAALLATMMCSTRSVYSWDIVADRIGDKLFFDRRPASQLYNLDMYTVSETAHDPPHDDASSSINTPTTLAQEAILINHNFIRNVLRTTEEPYFLKNNHSAEQGGNEQLTGFKYRKWNLGRNTDLDRDIWVVAKTEHDGALFGPNKEQWLATVRAFNEWDSAYSGGVDWRSKLDNQEGAVVATELRNNSCKIAKWTVQALLAGSDQIKFGYVSRVNPNVATKHQILGTHQYKPTEFATNITLNMDNGWGILRCIIDSCMRQPAGKYLIMKDPNKPVIRLYKLPENAFDSEAGESEEDDEAAVDADDEEK